MSENELISKFHKLNKLWLTLQIVVFFSGAVGWYFTTNYRIADMEKTQEVHSKKFESIDQELKTKVTTAMVLQQYNDLQTRMNIMDIKQEERFNRTIEMILRK